MKNKNKKKIRRNVAKTIRPRHFMVRDLTRPTKSEEKQEEMQIYEEHEKPKLILALN